MITYIEYQYGVSKGGINAGDRISSPFGFDTPDTDYTAKADYTGARVVETYTTESAGTKQTVAPIWGSKTVDSGHDNPKRQNLVSSVIIEKVAIGNTSYEVITSGVPSGTQVLVAPNETDSSKFDLTFASSIGESTEIKYGYVYE